MKARLAGLAAAFLLLLCLGKFFAKPLLAQVRAALVADIDTPGRAPYQRHLVFSCPAGSNRCGAEATPVPAGKRLVITNINGNFDAKSQPGLAVGVLFEHGVQGSSPNTPPLLLPVSFLATESNDDEFVVNVPVLAYFDPPDFPFILVSLSNNNITGHEMDFALSGYLVDCSVASCAPISF
jgi:hypothetical protein